VTGQDSPKFAVLRDRIIGECQMSIAAASRALSLVMEDVALRDDVANSFPFLTGLCEKAAPCAASFALSADTHK
jgi:hypothetical protein